MTALQCDPAVRGSPSGRWQTCSAHTPRNFTLPGSSHLNIQQGQAAKKQIKKNKQKTCTMCHLVNHCPLFKLRFSIKAALGGGEQLQRHWMHHENKQINGFWKLNYKVTAVFPHFSVSFEAPVRKFLLKLLSGQERFWFADVWKTVDVLVFSKLLCVSAGWPPSWIPLVLFSRVGEIQTWPIIGCKVPRKAVSFLPQASPWWLSRRTGQTRGGGSPQSSMGAVGVRRMHLIYIYSF